MMRYLLSEWVVTKEIHFQRRDWKISLAPAACCEHKEQEEDHKVFSVIQYLELTDNNIMDTSLHGNTYFKIKMHKLGMLIYNYACCLGEKPIGQWDLLLSKYA